LLIKKLMKHYILGTGFYTYIKYINKTKIKTKEHNNRQNINLCIRKLDIHKER